MNLIPLRADTGMVLGARGVSCYREIPSLRLSTAVNTHRSDDSHFPDAFEESFCRGFQSLHTNEKNS